MHRRSSSHILRLSPLHERLEAPLPVHPLTRASEEEDSWADALTGEMSKATADFPPQANAALPAALKFFDALISASSL